MLLPLPSFPSKKKKKEIEGTIEILQPVLKDIMADSDNMHCKPNELLPPPRRPHQEQRERERATGGRLEGKRILCG